MKDQQRILDLVCSIDPAATIQDSQMLILSVDKNLLPQILKELKNAQYLRFTILSDLFASDFPARQKRFEVVYNLLSLKLNIRLIIKVNLADQETISSVHDIFSVANWYEREILDMFGIEFENHPNLCRILTDYGFVGHPLRKDFPLTGYMQVKYDSHLEQVVYEPVNLEQEYRRFDFTSPWQGPQHRSSALPGDEKSSLSELKKL
jgi:NADH-quinone oxidoreductase subunit C